MSWVAKMLKFTEIMAASMHAHLYTVSLWQPYNEWPSSLPHKREARTGEGWKGLGMHQKKGSRCVRHISSQGKFFCFFIHITNNYFSYTGNDRARQLKMHLCFEPKVFLSSFSLILFYWTNVIFYRLNRPEMHLNVSPPGKEICFLLYSFFYSTNY